MKPGFVIIFIAMILSLCGLEEYKKPEGLIKDLFEKNEYKYASFLEKQNNMIIWERDVYLPLEMLAEPDLRIAGIHITPNNWAEKRSSILSNPLIKNYKTGKAAQLDLDGIFGSESANFKQNKLLIHEYCNNTIKLWGYNVSKDKITLLVDGLTQAIASKSDWMPDDKSAFVFLKPDNFKDVPQKSIIPKGPEVFTSNGEKSQLRTYSDLIETEYDKKLFRHYATSQLAVVNFDNGRIKKIGKPSLISYVSPSPNGKYFLVKIVSDEFLTSLPYWGFSSRYEIWDMKGNIVETVMENPSREKVPLGGVLDVGRRYQWHPYYPASLVWAQALDGGNPKTEVEFRDQIYIRQIKGKSGKQEKPVKLHKTRQRFSSIRFIERNKFIVYEYDRNRRWRIGVYIDAVNNKSFEIENLSTSDRFNDPGSFVYETNKNNKSVIMVRDKKVYLSGSGYSTEGKFPFLDELNLETGNKSRIWQSNKNAYQSFIAFSGKNEMIFRGEDKKNPSNYFLTNFSTNKTMQITEFEDKAKELSLLKKELITYKREDGLELSGTLYYPYGYEKGKRYPLILNAYPEEYTSKKTASQSINTTNTYTKVWGSSDKYLCFAGYAVLQGAKIAVVGDPETVNETFTKQIVSSAEAAINYLDSLGVVDPNKVAVTGHSYGAFMVANLLAHCDLFAAGIAKNGAYNRTLTPFGFQSERRKLWDAKEMYWKISPFMNAEKINEPLLLIHSQKDTNSGTYPMQSKRFFSALSSLGAICRYIELPLENHSYKARETHLHLLAEYVEFLDKYLK